MLAIYFCRLEFSVISWRSRCFSCFNLASCISWWPQVSKILNLVRQILKWFRWYTFKWDFIRSSRRTWRYFDANERRGFCSESNDFTRFSKNSRKGATFIFLAVGILLSGISFLGFIGSMKRNRCMLNCFSVIMFLICAVEILVMVVMTVFFPKFEELMIERFNNYTAVILFLLFFFYYLKF